jgi:segregation and condensation protein A
VDTEVRDASGEAGLAPGAGVQVHRDASGEGGPGAVPEAADRTGFHVHLEVFDGPFDLLLSLITRRQLDVTQVALAEVTDEFLAYIADRDDWDLDTASDFLVIAATLLDLKAARLLPDDRSEDPEDIAALEARDLLFARLLQYRAFKEMAGSFTAMLAANAGYHPRSVPLEPQFAGLLPELVWSLGPAELAAIARGVFARPPKPTEVPLAHLHAPRVSVAEQATIVSERLVRRGQLTFRDLVSDAGGNAGVIVARFLALLELYRSGAVAFTQVVALGELSVQWVGQGGDVEISDEFDQAEGDGI